MQFRNNCNLKANKNSLNLFLLIQHIKCFNITGLLTRNNSLDFELSQNKSSQKKLFNSIIKNFGYTSLLGGHANMHSVNTQVVTLDTFKKFLETRQMETKTDNELKMIIEVGSFLIAVG